MQHVLKCDCAQAKQQALDENEEKDNSKKAGKNQKSNEQAGRGGVGAQGRSCDEKKMSMGQMCAALLRDPEKNIRCVHDPTGRGFGQGTEYISCVACTEDLHTHYLFCAAI